MATDLCGRLHDEWWTKAQFAAKWKPKFECMQEIFYILTDGEETNVEIQCDIAYHKKANDLMNILSNWLSNENHVFTRIAILRVMPKLIEGFPKKLIVKYQITLLQTILTKQWMEKKKNCLYLVNPTLLTLWLKTGIELKCDNFKQYLLAAMKHRGKEARFSAADFVAKCTLYTKRKNQIAELCQDKEIGPLLGKLAMSDREKIVKIAACKALHGLNEMDIMKTKKVNKELSIQYNELLENRRGKKNLEEAIKQYHDDKVKRFGTYSGDDDDDDGDDEKKETLGNNERKKKKKKRRKHVRKTVTEEKPKETHKAGSGITFKIGAGGKLEPRWVERRKHKHKKPKNVEQGKPIDPKSLEDNRKALIASTKFKACNQRQTFKKLETWCKYDADSLRKTAKITDRVQTLEPIAYHIKSSNQQNNEWNDIYDAVIGLAEECMGWEGHDARNPMLAKEFLDLISEAMANSMSKKKDSGLFTVYLSWALQRLGESRFRSIATECLLNTCYQYSGKVVFSCIEKLLFEPEDPQRDPFKNDRNWGPIIKFLGDAVKEFGVDNFYVNRLINIIHQKIPKAKSKNAKDACYSAICELYQQLGSDWKDVLLSPCSRTMRKTLEKKLKAIANPGTYKQLRCTKRESPPQWIAASYVVNVWNTEKQNGIITNSSQYQRELLVYGYVRICGLTSIPNDILRICLFMIGFVDFHWFPMQHFGNGDLQSPQYNYNNFQFQFILRQQYKSKKRLYIKFNELNIKNWTSSYKMKAMILYFSLYWIDKRMQFRYILNINNWGKEHFINDFVFDNLCELEFYGDFNIIHLQINDTIQKTLKIYNQNIKLHKRYEFRWNLSNIKNAARYEENKKIHYYSPTFCGIWYLVFGDELELYLVSLPYNVSLIYIKWICTVKYDGKIKEMISRDTTMGLDQRENANNKSKGKFKSLKIQNIDLELISFDINIEILGVVDRNYLSPVSKFSNVIFKENLALYGIKDAEGDEMNEVSFGYNGISLQREIENILIEQTKNNNCIHAINDIATLLRSEYNEKILKLQNEINELRKVRNRSLENDANEYNKNEEEVKKMNEWLTETVKLPQYLSVFVENGFDSLEMIKEINDKQDLEYIGINLKGHQIKIMNEIIKL